MRGSPRPAFITPRAHERGKRTQRRVLPQFEFSAPKAALLGAGYEGLSWNPTMHRIPKRRIIHLGMCSLAFLAVAEPVVAAGDSFDGLYTGKRVLTKGPPGKCPAEESVSAAINGGMLTFTNSVFQDYPVGFDPQPDGTFTVTHVDSEGRIAEIHGRIIGGVLNADVAIPPCEHHWRLEKK